MIAPRKYSKLNQSLRKLQRRVFEVIRGHQATCAGQSEWCSLHFRWGWHIFMPCAQVLRQHLESFILNLSLGNPAGDRQWGHHGDWRWKDLCANQDDRWDRGHPKCSGPGLKVFSTPAWKNQSSSPASDRNALLILLDFYRMGVYIYL